MDLVHKNPDDAHETANALCEGQAAKLKPPGLPEKADYSIEALR